LCYFYTRNFFVKSKINRRSQNACQFLTTSGDIYLILEMRSLFHWKVTSAMSGRISHFCLLKKRKKYIKMRKKEKIRRRKVHLQMNAFQVYLSSFVYHTRIVNVNLRILCRSAHRRIYQSCRLKQEEKFTANISYFDIHRLNIFVQV